MFGCESVQAVRASSRNISRKSLDSEYSGRMTFSATGRKDAAGELLLGPVHLGHPALGDQADDAVAADLGSGMDGHGARGDDTRIAATACFAGWVIRPSSVVSRRLHVPRLAVLLLSLCTLAHSANPLAAMLAYDAKAPFALKELASETRDEAIVNDVTFQGIPTARRCGRTSSSLPRRSRSRRCSSCTGSATEDHEPHPVPRSSHRARRPGAVSLVDAMWSQPKWFAHRDVDADAVTSQRQAIDLLRAQDLLLSLPDVDPAR